jgi:PKD repeat protein
MDPVTISGNNNRYDRLWDVNRVELMIRKEYAFNYQLIEGATHTSDIRLGGRIGEMMMPDYMYRDGSASNGGGVTHIGNLTRQGIRPFTYATNGAHPYDDFYFTDFITRIHNNDPMDGGDADIAYCPENARYPDGRYEMIAQVTNVRNEVHEGPKENGELTPVEFILDNFKPYVKKVEAFINGKYIYRGEWHCSEYCSGSPENAGSIYFDFMDNTALFDPQVDYNNPSLEIFVETSEPMDWLNMSIPGFGGYTNLQLTQSPFNFFNRTHWEITLTGFPLVGGIDIRFVFDGRDFSHAPENGNSLLNLVSRKTESCTPLPNRKGNTANANSWNHYNIVPYGEDYTHILPSQLPCPANEFSPQGTYESNVLGNNCLSVDFEFEFNPSTCSFNFIDLSEGSIASWFWDFDDGPVSNLQNPTHAFTALGCYDVTLTITNEDGVYSSITKEVCFDAQEYPYVKEVNIYANDGSGNELIYSGVWQDMGDCVYFDKQTFPYDLSAMASASVEVHVLTNKPVVNMEMVLSGQSILGSGGDMNWSFFISAGFFEEQILSNGSVYQQFNFNGEDLNGNPVMEMRAMSGDMMYCVVVPQWTPGCNWAPTPYVFPNGDEVHVLEMYCNWIDFAFNVSQGTISLIHDGSPIQVTWTGPTINPQNMNNMVIENAEYGQYCAKVRFSYDCYFTKCILFPGPLTLYPEYTSPCPGMDDGAICVNVFGGSGAYSLIWQTGETDNCLEGLSTEGGGCLTVVDLFYENVIQECFQVPLYEAPALELAISSQPCPDGSGGQICLTSIEGTNPPFSLAWPNGGTDYCNEAIMPGATTCITATDGCNTEVETCLPIPPYPGIQTSNLVVVHPIENCPNGSITFSVSGGVAPYVITWNSPATGTILTVEPYLNNLPVGNYEIYVTDACGNAILPFYVQLSGAQAPFTIFIYINAYDITHVCEEGVASGAINLNYFYSGPPQFNSFSYLWSNGATTQDISDLLPGLYTVTMTNAFTGCQYTASATVELKTINPDWFSGFVLPSCANEPTGSVYLQPIYKNGQNFSFLWSNGETTSYPKNLPAGPNTVLVSNQFGCSVELSFEVGVSNPPTILLKNFKHAQTETAPTGLLEVSATGPNPPFSYLWSNGATGPLVNYLLPGVYTVTATNSFGCSAAEIFIVESCYWENQYGMMESLYENIGLTTQVLPQSLPGISDGAIDIQLVMGSGPLVYYWTGPNGFQSNSQDITGLDEGKYCATVTNGCDEVLFCKWVVNCDDFDVELVVTQNGSEDNICWTPCSSPVKVTATVQNYHGNKNQIHYSWEIPEENNPLIGLNKISRSFSYSLMESLGWADAVLTVTDEAGCSRQVIVSLFNYASFPSNSSSYSTDYLDAFVPEEQKALNFLLSASQGYAHTLPYYITGCGINYYCDFELVCTDNPVPISCESQLGYQCPCPAGANSVYIFSCDGANSVEAMYIATYTELLTTCKVRHYCLYLGLTGGETFLIISEENHPGECLDSDGDGIPDYMDNCPAIFSYDLTDTDGDGVGDVCDNCPYTWNPSQSDSDGNGIGDACDYGNPDFDGDGILNLEDNCPEVYNPDQTDSDGDGIGDACDNCPEQANIPENDSDGDGWPNLCDNCPNVYNPDQNQSACQALWPGDDLGLRSVTNWTSQETLPTIRLHPNPTTGNLTIAFFSEQQSVFHLKLKDLTGKDVFENRLEALPGDNSFELSLPMQLTSGLYFVHVKSSCGINEAFRIVLIR